MTEVRTRDGRWLSVMQMEGDTQVRRVAALDVGSNTVRGLAATMREDGTLATTLAAFRTTALGRGLAEGGLLGAEAIADTADFVARFLERAGGMDEVHCVATAAARDAENADVLRDALFEQAGVVMETIPGAMEAHLSFVGALRVVNVDCEYPVVADIGGCSTELVTQNAAHYPNVSAAIGARSLSELRLKSDPPTRYQTTAARKTAREKLAEAMTLLEGADVLVAAGGTACTAALLADKWELSANVITKLRRAMCKVDLAERRELIAFDPPRAEVICGGLILLEALAERAPGERVVISAGGVREGLLLRRTGARGIVGVRGAIEEDLR